MEQVHLNTRLQDLRGNLEKLRARIHDYEDELIDEDDPNLRSKYERRIERLKKDRDRYDQEYESLKSLAVAKGTASVQVKSEDLLDVGKELVAMKHTLDVLLVSQQELLMSFNQHEQNIYKAISQKLDDSERNIVQHTVAAIELNLLSEEEMRHFLEDVRNAVVTVPPTAPMPAQRNQVEEILDDVSLDVKHRLKMSIPMIPFLLNYETEVGIGSTDNLRKIWNSIKTKLFV